MKLKKIVLLAAALFSALGLCSPDKLTILEWNGQEMAATKEIVNLETASLLTPESQIAVPDCLQFEDEQVVINRCDGKNESEWVSPKDWQVKEVVRGDLNRDGIDEFGLLVWRAFKPWPIDKFLPNPGRIANFHNAQNLSCHFILIGWDGEKYRELWAGSALADPISHLQVVDIDIDGFKEVIAIEGKYDASQKGNLTIWKWQGFGFTLLDRIEGEYSNYSLYRNGKRILLLADF